jgi:hypothetical protein
LRLPQIEVALAAGVVTDLPHGGVETALIPTASIQWVPEQDIHEVETDLERKLIVDLVGELLPDEVALVVTVARQLIDRRHVLQSGASGVDVG